MKLRAIPFPVEIDGLLHQNIILTALCERDDRQLCGQSDASQASLKVSPGPQNSSELMASLEEEGGGGGENQIPPDSALECVENSGAARLRNDNNSQHPRPGVRLRNPRSLVTFNQCSLQNSELHRGGGTKQQATRRAARGGCEVNVDTAKYGQAQNLHFQKIQSIYRRRRLISLIAAAVASSAV